jgi:outer membrane protein TolC
LQADVELAHVLHRGIVLGAERAVIVARLNGLLHRMPAAPLPLPPEALEPPLDPPAASTTLQARALETRPELEELRARIGGRRSAVSLAERNYFPDFGVMASYDSMWGEEQHRWMAGVSIDLPFVQLAARSAGVEQAEARLSETEAMLARMEDDVRVEVEHARERLIEAQHVVHLYRDRLLPAARAQIDAARAGYETGQNSFQALVDAERSLRTSEINYHEALAQVGQRRAELSRAIGEMP